MKKHVFVLLVALFLLTSCGEKDSGNDLSKPPELTVVCGEASTEAVKGTFEWSYPQKDGTTAHIIADALLPLEMEELLTPLVMKPSPLSHIDPRTAYLIFDGPLPDRLQLYRWHDDQGDTYTVHLEAEKVEMGKVNGKRIFAFQVQLSEEYGIYEVLAQWKDGEHEGGEVSYVFAAEMRLPELQSIG
ncbi:MAG: hypothetical protein E7446_00645 [Ruminococcaceae bacterium]|nr:hypothetical protein [Oscillospiraceae bacterium]